MVLWVSTKWPAILHSIKTPFGFFFLESVKLQTKYFWCRHCFSRFEQSHLSKFHTNLDVRRLRLFDNESHETAELVILWEWIPWKQKKKPCHSWKKRQMKNAWFKCPLKWWKVQAPIVVWTLGVSEIQAVYQSCTNAESDNWCWSAKELIKGLRLTTGTYT